MGVVLALVVVALLLGGVGLLVDGLLWLLAVALIVVVAGASLSFRGRGAGTR